MSFPTSQPSQTFLQNTAHSTQSGTSEKGSGMPAGQSGFLSAVHSASVCLHPDTEELHPELCQLRYLIADPTGNITILVLDPVPVCDQPAAAAELMKLEPSAEQVGFLTIPDNSCGPGSSGIVPADPASGPYTQKGMAPADRRRGQRNDAMHRSRCDKNAEAFLKDSSDIALRMAGGEFCGNASMSAAAFQAWRTGLANGQFVLRVSGADDLVVVNIEAGEIPLTWSGEVHMPDPQKIEMVSFPGGEQLPVVTFDGISHVIIQEPLLPKGGIQPDLTAGSDCSETVWGCLETIQHCSGKTWAEEHAREWCRYLQADALGILFLNASADRLTPLVYVPGADTLFWETSCGSGSAAVGAWLASREGKKVTVSLMQPGGALKVTASPGGPLLLKGTVVFI